MDRVSSEKNGMPPEQHLVPCTGFFTILIFSFLMKTFFWLLRPGHQKKIHWNCLWWYMNIPQNCFSPFGYKNFQIRGNFPLAQNQPKISRCSPWKPAMPSYLPFHHKQLFLRLSFTVQLRFTGRTSSLCQHWSGITFNSLTGKCPLARHQLVLRKKGYQQPGHEARTEQQPSEWV